MKKHIIIICGILVFVLIVGLITSNSPIFLDKKSLLIVLSDKNYLNSFSKKDLYVRKVSNIKDYKKNIAKSVVNISLSEKFRLFRLTNLIDFYLYNKNVKRSYFDSNKFVNIPWKFGIVNGYLYEAGLPHTRKDVIIFERSYLDNVSNKELINTLIHEKIHVYQKTFGKDIEKYLDTYNFKIVGVRHSNIRANPDTNKYIYMDKNNIKYEAVYNKNAKSVMDVTYSGNNSQSFEHPFEKMAIELSNNLF